MRYSLVQKHLTRVLAFIMVGAVFVVFTDLFILNDKPYEWWSVQQRQGKTQSGIDIASLKEKNAAYLTHGVTLPESGDVPSVRPLPLPSASPAPGPQRPAAKLVDRYFPEIEPAVGMRQEKIENIPVKRDPFVPVMKDVESLPPEKPVLTEEAKKADDSLVYDYTAPHVKGGIAIIIDDMGLTLPSKLVEVMPGPLTLSYLPYADNLDERTKRAAANGHALMVHMPMEPLNENADTGPHALRVEQSREEIRDNLTWALSRFSGFSGINNHMGSRMTQDKKAMDVVMQVLKERGLYFIDSRTTSDSVAVDAAQAHGIPYAQRDVFLDHEITPEAIREALKALENKARKNGYAIAIGHPHMDTIEALREWIPTLQGKGLHLVSAQDVLHQPKEKNSLQAGAKRP